MKNTRNRIIKATIHLIETKGIEAVNMRDLGSELGLSRSAVYNHFKSKEDLLAVVVAASFDALYRDLQKLFTPQIQQKVLLKNMMAAYYQFGTAHNELYSLMFLKNWRLPEYGEVDNVAIQSFLLMQNNIPDSNQAAIVMAFIHGLIELNNKGHNESEKGLNDPNALIDDFIELLFAGKA